MDPQQLATFITVAGILIVAPGPDSTLVLSNGMSAGREAGVITAFGTTTGILMHASAAVVGLSALLTASAVAFTVVKIAGAVYLVWLGLRSLWSAWRGSSNNANPISSRPRSGERRRVWRSFRQGVLTNVLNPKVAVFFLTFLPQFVVPGGGARLQLAVLGLIFWAMTLAWLGTVAMGAGLMRGIVQRPRVSRSIDAVVGSVFVAFGASLLTTHR